ncbi:MAG: Coenzyme F420 hydrogenase/dehydrogenase, beta subunit C-terminal domain [Eubacterium sp.]|nr:Coenzyme F420 hydrogenase/dehydrogenase, beta subunit C-terminal domain [Eubacterium sp.]
MIVPNEANCTGCTACYTVCPHNAIGLENNDHGFLVATVNESICVDCGICEKTCPQTTSFVQDDLEDTYAFINLDINERCRSTSGGFFISIAKTVLEKGGFVCGCILKDMFPMHILTDSIEQVILMQGSKYVQSYMGDCFSKISDLLKQSVPVFFTGTSCQVAGLKNYLKVKRIDDASLLCADFICHGVPSARIWNDYVQYYETHFKRNALDYKFRSKRYGWGKTALGGDYFSFFVYDKKGEKGKGIDDKIYYSRLWRYIFFSNLCLREVCYDCKYTSLNKPSDFTMADFWGVEKIVPELDDGKGCSLIICNSKVGVTFIEDARNARIVQVNRDDAISQQVNAHQASLSNDLKDAFWIDYDNNGYAFVINKYFGYNTPGRIKGFIKRVLFQLKLRYLY